VVACGAYHALVGTTEGQLFSFGQNSFGQLGIAGNRQQVRILPPDRDSVHLTAVAEMVMTLGKARAFFRHLSYMRTAAKP
jgi:alpha-tubulin suppressor-like RCC1 family protein